MKGWARSLRSRSVAAALGWVACGCAMTLGTPACRSSQGAAEQGWSYERSGDQHVVDGAEFHRSVDGSHYDLKLQGRSTIHGSGEEVAGSDRADSQDWQCFLVAVGPAGRTEPPVNLPVLELEGRSADVTGELVATFCEPRFDFALPPGLLEACADTGARWTMRDGATRLDVSLSADDVRGFLTALKWADQVGVLEERAAPQAHDSLLPEPQEEG